MTKRLKRKRRTEKRQEKYVNYNCILGTVAEVERLWSIVKYVSSEERRGMTPQLFKELLVLRINSQYWNENFVADALHER